MSQARAISKPPPKAAPSIAAMVGTGRLPENTRDRKTSRNQQTSEVRSCDSSIIFLTTQK